MKIEKLVFEKCQLVACQVMPEYKAICDHMSLNVTTTAEGLVFFLRSWTLEGHKTQIRQEKEKIEFPATPWQFCKQQYTPQWFQHLFPIKMQTREYLVTEHYHYICPHVAPVNNNDFYQHYIWMATMSGQIDSQQASELQK